jgi:hypothetical protein
MKYWEIIANKIIKVGFSVGWISALDDDGPQFGLLTPIAATESVSLCAPMKS